MINWREIRSVEQLRAFSKEFQVLPWAIKEPILKEMADFMEDYRGFTEIKKMPRGKVEQKPLRKKIRRRRQ